jgi:phosphoserine phosphatase RsbU/P
MDIIQLEYFQDKLLDRKNRLSEFTRDYPGGTELHKLLSDIDDALLRIKNGTFGICQVCNDPIEMDRLEVDPLLSFCLDHLTTRQQRNLEEDLKLAAKIQRNLLPPKNLQIKGWDIAYHYEPAGLVSGDYCDIIFSGKEKDPFYLIVGDVTGKGVAAAMLMSHLHAMFHTLIPLNLISNELMERINRVLCESIPSGQFATLLLAGVHNDGVVKLSNAGHCRPILFNDQITRQVDSNGIPLGVLCETKYDCDIITMKSGDTLFLYSDGLIEAMRDEEMFGIGPLLVPRDDLRKKTSSQIVENTLSDLNSFLKGSQKNDDLTLMVLKKL